MPYFRDCLTIKGKGKYSIKLTDKEYENVRQFVAYILGKTEVWQGIPELTKPMDFLRIPQNRIIFEGSIREYKMLHAVENSNQQRQTDGKQLLSPH